MQRTIGRWQALGPIAAISIAHLFLFLFFALASIRVWIPLPTVDIPEETFPHVCAYIFIILAFPLVWTSLLGGPPPILTILPNSILWGIVLYSAYRAVRRYYHGRPGSGILEPVNLSSQDRATLRTFGTDA